MDLIVTLVASLTGPDLQEVLQFSQAKFSWNFFPKKDHEFE